MSNNDEWCYLDLESGSERSPSFDMVEPELELEPMYVEEVCAPKTTTINTKTELLQAKSNQDETEHDAVDVFSLLKDTERTLYTRDTMQALLAPVHQRYVATGNQAKSATLLSRKRIVREAFVAPSQRQHAESATTYADRLRAAMPSRPTFANASLQVEMTDVQPFTRDQATQTKHEPEAVCCHHAESLSSALERSVNLSLKLKAKSQDAEKADLHALRLEIQLDERTREKEVVEKELDTAQRALCIFRKRSELTADFHDHLKHQIEQLRGKNASLQQRMEVLAGGLDLAPKSIEELECLEDSLSDVMNKIRLALRTKYHEAMTGEPEDTDNQTEETTMNYCVVCLEKLACVRLEPCSHHVLCSQCAVRVTMCPVDRQSVSHQVLTHGLDAYATN